MPPRAPLPRLSFMMFLQYAVWGAWLPPLALYLQNGLGFTPAQVGAILGLGGSIGAITAPFIAGQIADRSFSTERFLAVLLILGGAIKWYTAHQTEFSAWLWLSIAYSIVYMPTLALSNSLAFAHLADRSRQFPLVRVWGTIGWIAASWAFPIVWLQTDIEFRALPPFLAGTEVPDATMRIVDALKFSALISFGYAAYCLFLPHTPPKRDAAEPLAFAKAFGLLRTRSFAVLVAAALVIAIIHHIYFMQASPFLKSIGLRDSDIQPAMSLGQFSEIIVMALLGLFLKRLGFRTILTVGALAYFLRYSIWSMTELPPAVIVASQALHGVCFACFWAAAFIYVDRIAPADVRHSAQTVFGIMFGGAPILAGYVVGVVATQFTANETLDYSGFWMTFAVLGLAAALVLGLLFRDEGEHAGNGGVRGET